MPPAADTTWRAAWLGRFYDRARGWRDGTEEFHALCASVLPEGAPVLEIGAGPSNATSRWLASRHELHGVDVDSAVRGNDALVSARVLERAAYPFEGGRFGGAVSNWVVEHVADPGAHLREVARVLKPGAPYVLRTSNRWHPIMIVSRLTPHSFHRVVANRVRALPAGAPEPYPTTYALCSERAIRAHARAAGLDVELVRFVEKEPSYGMAWRGAFLALLAWERLVNVSDLFAPLRIGIQAVLRKPRNASGT